MSIPSVPVRLGRGRLAWGHLTGHPCRRAQQGQGAFWGVGWRSGVVRCVKGLVYFVVDNRKGGPAGPGVGLKKGEVDGVVMPFGQNVYLSFPFVAGLIPSWVPPPQLGVRLGQSRLCVASVQMA